MLLPFEPVNEILKCDHSNERQSEQYFPVVLFIMVCKVVLTIELKIILKGGGQVSSVEEAPDYCAGGLRFKPWLDQHPGSLITEEKGVYTVCESARNARQTCEACKA